MSRRFRGLVIVLPSPVVTPLNMLAAQRTYIVAIATFVIVTTLFFYAFGDQGVFVVARITRPYVNPGPAVEPLSLTLSVDHRTQPSETRLPVCLRR